MSVWVTFAQVNKNKAEEMLVSLADNNFPLENYDLQSIETIKADIKKYREEHDTESLQSAARDMAWKIIEHTGTVFHENINNVEPYTHLLFKLLGFKEFEYRNGLEKIDFSTWKKVFEGLNKEILINIKTEIESSSKWFEGAFDTFVATLKDIKDVFKGCDGVNTLFIVTVEGEGDTSYIDYLQTKILNLF